MNQDRGGNHVADPCLNSSGFRYHIEYSGLMAHRMVREEGARKLERFMIRTKISSARPGVLATRWHDNFARASGGIGRYGPSVETAGTVPLLVRASRIRSQPNLTTATIRLRRRSVRSVGVELSCKAGSPGSRCRGFRFWSPPQQNRPSCPSPAHRGMRDKHSAVELSCRLDNRGLIWPWGMGWL